MTLTNKKAIHLDKSSRKFICPACGKRRFVRYIDQETGQYLNDHMGRCDREVNCGYFQKPGKSLQNQTFIHKPEPKPMTRHFISMELVKSTCKQYEKNHLVTYLNSIFPPETVNSLLQTYHLGTTKSGSTIFWQVDRERKARSGKIIFYDPATGRRRKDLPVSWVHRKMRYRLFDLQQCLFGLHLVNKTKPGATVGIVESEKTAMICTAYFPEITWLATGGLQNLKPELFHGLLRFRLVLFPDLGAFDKWTNKARTIRRTLPGIMISVSDYLEALASDQERASGYDLADYLVLNPSKTVLSENF